MKRWLKIIGTGLLSAITVPSLCAFVISFIRFVKGIVFGCEMNEFDITAGVLIILVAGLIGAFVTAIENE